MKAPCKDCPERHYACHDTCEKYIAFVKWSREEYKKREMRRNVNDAKFSLVMNQLRESGIYRGKPLKARYTQK